MTQTQPLLTEHTDVSPFPPPAPGAAPLRAATKSANDRPHVLRRVTIAWFLLSVYLCGLLQANNKPWLAGVLGRGN